MNDALPDRPIWCEPSENAFRVRGVDVRPLTWRTMATTSDQSIARRFASSRHSTGEEYIGQRPSHPIAVDCHVSYPALERDSGPIFMAPEMEDK
jgi:hypothetical protein